MALAPACLVEAPGFEPGSRPDPGLAVYKTAALPLCYASTRKMALSAGVEPASFQLRFARLEDETGTRAWSQRADSNRCLRITSASLCQLSYIGKFGSHGENRTPIFFFVGEARFQSSHAAMVVTDGIEPPSPALQAGAKPTQLSDRRSG
jgi:hypothetical protein